jgi:hypothetical protein
VPIKLVSKLIGHGGFRSILSRRKRHCEGGEKRIIRFLDREELRAETVEEDWRSRGSVHVDRAVEIARARY